MFAQSREEAAVSKSSRRPSPNKRASRRQPARVSLADLVARRLISPEDDVLYCRACKVTAHFSARGLYAHNRPALFPRGCC
jgi:hypothetical protein